MWLPIALVSVAAAEMPVETHARRDYPQVFNLRGNAFAVGRSYILPHEFGDLSIRWTCGARLPQEAAGATRHDGRIGLLCIFIVSVAACHGCVSLYSRVLVWMSFVQAMKH